MGSAWALSMKPDVTPHPLENPTFDSHYGFSGSREKRVMIATQEELESAKIPLQDRDYCSHLLLKYRSCRTDVFPFVYKCEHQKHEYLTCEYEDYVLRMKEYERERRLLERKKKIESKA